MKTTPGFPGTLKMDPKEKPDVWAVGCKETVTVLPKDHQRGHLLWRLITWEVVFSLFVLFFSVK